MNLTKLVLFFSLFCLLPCGVKAFVPQEAILQNEHIAFVTPGIFNPKYFSFEIGYVVNKKIKPIEYNYHAFVEAFLAEESYTTNEKLRAGELGGKGGVLLPTQPWIPLYLHGAFGFAKTALHESPWFGKREQSVARKDLFFAEGGALYAHKKRVLFRYSYQYSSVKYIKLKNFISVGMSF